MLEFVGNLGSDAQEIALQAAVKSAASENLEDGASVLPSLTSVENKDKEQIQLLDTLAVEQQRGITVKASAASMLYPHHSAKGPLKCLLLNMVDTPGHIDFGFEVCLLRDTEV